MKKSITILLFVFAFVLGSLFIRVNAEEVEETLVTGNVTTTEKEEERVVSTNETEVTQNNEVTKESEVLEPALNEVVNLASEEIEKEETPVSGEVSTKAIPAPVKAASDTPTGFSTTVNVIDTRTGKVVKSITNKNTQGGTSSQPLSGMASGISDDFKIASGDYIYTFKGFYDAPEGGNKIEKDYVPGTNYPELLKLYSASDATAPKSYRLYVQAANDIEENKTVNVYIQWTQEERPKTVVNFIFKEEDMDGNPVNSGNGVALTQSTTLHDGDSSSRTSRALQFLEFTNGDKYTLIGWYEEDGKTPVSETMYNDGDSTRIKVSYKRTSESPETVTLTYILKWEKHVSPIYNFNVYDEVSTGSHHWDNTNGHFGAYNYTFKTPDKKTHYELQYYKKDDIKKQPGETYSHDITAQGDGTKVTEDFYAYWKADVTLSLYDGSTLLGSKSQFDSISVSDVLSSNPTKVGYRFLGWLDENNKETDITTFEADEVSTKPTPKEVKLYANWERIMVDVKVKKEWNDNNNNDNKRPTSVTVELKNGNEVVETQELSEDNEWTYTFNVPEYDETSKINYTVSEQEVKGYTPEITGSIENGFVITNTHENETYKNVTIKKVWDDNENEDTVRPTSVTIHVLANGEEVKEIVLNEENNWEATIESLDVYSNKEEIKYSVSEDEVEFYETSVGGDVENGFTIKNYHEPWPKGDGEDPVEPSKDNSKSNNPKTIDNIYLSFITLIISLVGFIYSLRKNIINL